MASLRRTAIAPHSAAMEDHTNADQGGKLIKISIILSTELGYCLAELSIFGSILNKLLNEARGNDIKPTCKRKKLCN